MNGSGKFFQRLTDPCCWERGSDLGKNQANNAREASNHSPIGKRSFGSPGDHDKSKKHGNAGDEVHAGECRRPGFEEPETSHELLFISQGGKMILVVRENNTLAGRNTF